MTRYEEAAIKGFINSGATIEQIMEVFWYLSKKEIEKVIENYKMKIK